MTIAWHDEARRLRNQGLTLREICRALSKPLSTVSYALNENGEKERDRQRNRAVRKDTGGRHHGYERSYVKPHTPRVIRKFQNDPLAVARRFAAGEIDRAELSRQFWSGA